MRKIYELATNWDFRAEDESKTQAVKVSLPHTWNTDLNFYRTSKIYERLLKIHPRHTYDSIFIEFDGANVVCQVYLNEVFIGEHRGGYSRFRFELTAHYNWQTQNQLRVVVDNSPTQEVSPLNGDFSIYGGLYRMVRLICVPESHFDLLFYGSSGIIPRTYVLPNGEGLLEVESHVRQGESLEILWLLTDAAGKCVVLEKTKALIGKHTMSVNGCKIWHGKENPYLYQLTAVLLDEETILDKVTLSIGFRKCQLDSQRGFILNGQPIRIHGVSKHQDFGMVGNAVQQAHITKDFDLIEEIGANALRLSHYQHNQETYDQCDQIGYITWAEIPMMAMPDRLGVMENAKTQLKELIYQNCHHPAICFWGIQNEIAMDGESLAMYRGVQELNELVHQLLPNELSASANMYYVKNDSALNGITDLTGYNLYCGWYYGQTGDLSEWLDTFHQDNPSVSIGLSEYGADCNIKFHSEAPKLKDYSEEYQARYHEQTYEIIASKPYIWGSFLWNMFDFGSEVRDEGGTKGQNCKGLVTIDREIKKDSFYFYKAKWSKEKFIHLCEKRFIDRTSSEMNIRVYSNLKEVTLLVNNEKKITQQGSGVFLFQGVPLQMGVNNIRVIGNENDMMYGDECIYIRTNEKELSYLFEDPNPGVVVENWFTQEKGELDFFPEGFYSIKDRLGDLMVSEEAWDILKVMAPKVVERATPGAPVTLLWVFNKMAAFFTDEVILEINDMLTKVPKKIELK